MYAEYPGSPQEEPVSETPGFTVCSLPHPGFRFLRLQRLGKRVPAGGSAVIFCVSFCDISCFLMSASVKSASVKSGSVMSASVIVSWDFSHIRLAELWNWWEIKEMVRFSKQHSVSPVTSQLTLMTPADRHSARMVNTVIYFKNRVIFTILINVVMNAVIKSWGTCPPPLSSVSQWVIMVIYVNGNEMTDVWQWQWRGCWRAADDRGSVRCNPCDWQTKTFLKVLAHPPVDWEGCVPNLTFHKSPWTVPASDVGSTNRGVSLTSPSIGRPELFQPMVSAVLTGACP